MTVEALVLASLRGTDANHRKKRSQILGEVQQNFPSRDAARLSQLIDAALASLKYHKRVTVSVAADDFALHFDEQKRIDQSLSRLVEDRKAVRKSIAQRISDVCRELDIDSHPEDSEAFIDIVESIFEQLLYAEGEDYVRVINDIESVHSPKDTYQIAKTALLSTPRDATLTSVAVQDLAEIACETVTSILARPSEHLQLYLRNLADAYTLLAFMRQTPDVQRAVAGLVYNGKLVLDTTVILPCFGEILLPTTERRFTNLFLSAREVGMKLMITAGV